MKNKILNVLTQSDENYLIPGSVMVVSLCENNKHFDEINVFYLSLGISSTNQRKLQSLSKNYKNLTINFIDSQKYQEEAENLELSLWNGKLITWFKLLVLSDLKINTDRVLYLNPHSLVTGSLDELTNIGFDQNIMLNIYDYFENFPGVVEIKNFKKDDPYYNCGLMLFNHKKWLQDGIGDKVKKSLLKKSDYKIADQDFCNTFFKNKIGVMPFEYYVWETFYFYNPKSSLKVWRLYNKPNYYKYDDVASSLLAPKIIYLTSAPGRTWYKNTKAPAAPLFIKYLKLTPFADYERPYTNKNIAYFVTFYTPRFLSLWINFMYSFLKVNVLWKLNGK
jgi:lipopolysaccharide biosynthesis glycosyltransferase